MCVVAQGTWALGLGRVNVQSALGETLRAEIDITSLAPEEEGTLRVRIAPPESYRAAGVDYSAVLPGTQAALLRRPDGRPYLRISSERTVQEPFLDVILELTWASGRLVREYTLLLDPPTRTAPPVQAAAPTAPTIVAAAPVPPPITPAAAPEAPAVSSAPQSASESPGAAAAPEAPREPQAAPATPASPSAPPAAEAAPSGSVEPSTATASPVSRSEAPAATPLPSAAIEQPARVAGAEPKAATASEVGPYKVVSGDTLSRIARDNQREGVSLEQMLVSLLRSNPKAFVDNNMNRLKAGVVLSMPSEEQAKAVSLAEARSLIRVQSADFDAYRQRLAANVPTAPAVESQRQAKGEVQAAVEDRKQAAATPDKLTLSQGAVKSGAPETKVSQASEKREASQREAELKRNVEDLKKLAEGATSARPAAAAPSAASGPAVAVAAAVPVPVPVAKPAAAAAASATAAASKPAALATASAPAAPKPAADTPVAKPVAAAASAPAAAASARVEAVAAAGPAALATTAQQAKPASAAAASAAAVAASKPTAPPPAAEEPGILGILDGMMDNPMVLPGAGALVLLLAGLGLYRMRGRLRKDSGETSFLESRLQPDSFFGASGGQRVDTRDASGVSSSMSYSLSQLDAIGDVDPVAEADVYLAYGRDLQAEEILKEAMRSNPERLAIRTKLLEVYAKRRDTKGFELLATQLYSLCRGEGEDWTKAQELGRQIDPDNSLYRAGGRPSNVVTQEGGHMVEPLGASTMPQSVMPATSSFASSVGRDPRQAARGGPEPDVDLDLDLATASAATSRAPVHTQPMPGNFSNPGAAPAAKPAASRAPAPAPSMDFDLGSISLDLGGSPQPAAPAQALANDPALDFSDFTLPAQASAPAPLDSSDPLSRKLELAEEFRQIGDMEGARDLLEEVIGRASGSIKSKAQSMLDNLG